MTHNKAPHSGVDEKNLHGVAHRKRRQDEQRREGFSLSSAPSKFLLILIIALAFFALSLTGCDDKGDDPPPDNTPQPETVTHTVVLNDWGLTFDVKYEKLPSEPLPDYADYLEGQLELMNGAVKDSPNGDALDHLLIKGNRFTVRVKYTGDSFESLVWNTATQEFDIHHDWLSTPGVNLSSARMRTAFNAVETE